MPEDLQMILTGCKWGGQRNVGLTCVVTTLRWYLGVSAKAPTMVAQFGQIAGIWLATGSPKLRNTSCSWEHLGWVLAGKKIFQTLLQLLQLWRQRVGWSSSLIKLQLLLCLTLTGWCRCNGCKQLMLVWNAHCTKFNIAFFWSQTLWWKTRNSTINVGLYQVLSANFQMCKGELRKLR